MESQNPKKCSTHLTSSEGHHFLKRIKCHIIISRQNKHCFHMKQTSNTGFQSPNCFTFLEV